MAAHPPPADAGTALPTLRQLLRRLVLVLLLPATLAVAAQLWQDASREEARILQQLAATTANAGLPVAQQVASARRGLEGLGRRIPELMAQGPQQLQAAMQALVAREGLGGVALLDTRGVPQVSTFAPLGTPLPVVREPELLASLTSGLSRVTGLFVGPQSQRQVVGVTVPVIVDGQVRYSLNGSITADRLQDLMQRQAAPAGWSLVLMDAQGTVLARSGVAAQPVGAAAEAAIVQRARARGPVTQVHDDLPLAGQPAYTMLRTSTDLGWTTVVQVPRQAVLLGILQDLLLAGGGLMLTALLSIWGAGRIAGRIAGSIDRVGRPTPVGDEPPLAFREAVQLRQRLDAAAQRAEAARLAESLARSHLAQATETFEKRLLREIEASEAAIARELHDLVGSSLAGAGLLIASAKARPELVTTAWLDRCLGEVERTAQLTRKLARGLLPVGSDSGALEQAMELLAAHWDSLGQLQCTLDVQGAFDDVPPEAGNQVWRIAQEAITNALRHGKARRVDLLLARDAQGCVLTIVDDGQGFDPTAAEGMGMRSMRLRSQLMGGTVRWAASEAGGCAVTIRWPGPQAAA